MTDKKLKLSKFDAADYLDTQEARAEYLSLAAKQGDFLPALDTVVRSMGVTKVAKAAKVSRSSLYKSLGGAGKTEFATVLKLASAVGLEISFNPVNGKKARPKAQAKTAAAA